MFSTLLRLPEEVRKGYDTSSLEMIVHAAAPCPDELPRLPTGKLYKRLIRDGHWRGPGIRIV